MAFIQWLELNKVKAGALVDQLTSVASMVILASSLA